MVSRVNKRREPTQSDTPYPLFVDTKTHILYFRLIGEKGMPSHMTGLLGKF